MRINNAQRYAEKILDFVTAMSTSGQATYAGTKEKLIILATTCNQIESAIAEFLGQAKPRGINAECPLNGNQKIDELCQKVEALENIIKSGTFSQPEIISEESPCQHHSTEDTLIEKTKLQNEVINPEFVNSGDAKSVIHKYAVILETAAKTDHQNVTINKCCDVIWRWFDKRFIFKPSGFKPLRFNVLKIREYIASIVVYLGYYIEKDMLDDALCNLDSWIDKIGVEEKTTSYYAVPFECYQIFKKQTADYLNVAAILIWDKLLDAGFDKLGAFQISDGRYVKRVGDIVFELISEIEEDFNKHGEFAKVYCHIADNPDAFECYNIV